MSRPFNKIKSKLIRSKVKNLYVINRELIGIEFDSGIFIHNLGDSFYINNLKSFNDSLTVQKILESYDYKVIEGEN